MSLEDRGRTTPSVSMEDGKIYSVKCQEETGETIQRVGRFEAPNTLWDIQSEELVTLDPTRTSEIEEVPLEEAQEGESSESKTRLELVKFYVAVEQFVDWEIRTNDAIKKLTEECGGVTVHDAVGCWLENDQPSWPERTKVFVVATKYGSYPSAFKILGEIFDAERVILIERDGRAEPIWNLYGLIRKQIKDGLIDELTAKGLLPDDFKLAKGYKR